jgi:ATP-dependent exoDNAse (exonuclease V) beta subunit
VLEWATALASSERSLALVAHWVERACGQHPPDPAWLPATHLSAALNALTQQAWQILNHPASAPWLDPAQCHWAGNEIELWHEGHLLRLDRLVVKQAPDGGQQWWVIDYKMNETPQRVAAYVAQLMLYAQALAQQEPSAQVRAAFINLHGEFLPLVLPRPR